MKTWAHARDATTLLTTLVATSCTSCGHRPTLEHNQGELVRSRKAPAAAAPVSATPKSTLPSGAASYSSAPVGASSSGSAKCPALLVAARRGGSAPDRYVSPSKAEQTAMRSLFERFVSDQTPSLAAEVRRTLGFRVERVNEWPSAFALLEQAQAKRGGGAYVIHAESDSNLVIQAPHTFFDEGTLPIACDFFERSSALALFLDTAHRYRAAGEDESGAFPADLAHSKSSLFQAATQGLLRARPNATLVQLHGFGSLKSVGEVVVSSGRTGDDDLVDRVQKALAKVAGPVLRFPEDTKELGATTNVQGALARKLHARFIHIEMSAPLRAQLVDDAALRGRFLDALTQGLRPR